MKVFVTNKKQQFKSLEVDFKAKTNVEMKLIKAYPKILKQEIIGFGGAFTESSAYVWSKMSEEKQKELIGLYFGKGGNDYNFCRTHIQSCDFSLGNRAYVENGDVSCRTFSIAGDFEYQIPFIKAALELNKDIELLASPWSPPAFMKTNNKMNEGGRLMEEHYDNWAKIMTQYLLAYEKEGIVIKRLTVQNEPAAVQTWDSCVYSAEEEKIFACNYLRKNLDEVNLKDVKINIWDHNKDLLVERVDGVFTDDDANASISGVAFHWYSGDHFESLNYIHEKYPDKELLFTEGCVEYSRFATADQTQNAIMYAHDIIGNLKAGMNGFIDWNLILDEKGGPNHVLNFCDAPIMCNYETDTIDVKLSYHYIGHFSRFIKPGAKRMLTSCYTKNLESVGFVNPDGENVVVILNNSDGEQAFELYDGEKACELTIDAKEIMTICW
jgi:glucosylceramidase